MKRLKTFLSGCRDIEIFLDLVSITWGIWIILVHPSLSIYRYYLAIAPAYVWGGLAITMGASNILFAIFNSKLTRITRVFLVFFWIFSSISFILSDWSKASSFIYPYVALAYIYTLFWED